MKWILVLLPLRVLYEMQNQFFQQYPLYVQVRFVTFYETWMSYITVYFNEKARK